VVRRAFTVALPDGRRLQLGARTLVMGIINVTPDSFSDGGLRLEPERAIEAGVQMVAAGADILDIGGESTRPGALPLSEDEELRRVLPVVRGLAARVQVPLSIDTYKATVADAALGCGATIVNDISGLRYEPGLAQVVARRQAALVLMHTRGRSRDMYEQAVYHDVVDEVRDELRESMAFALAAGVAADRVMVDPGLGFAKQPAHSYELLARLDEFGELGRPLLVGASRKGFLARPSAGDLSAAGREWSTAAAVTASVLRGAHIVRVHGVTEMVPVVRVADEIRKYHRASTG
jgi:dihydropteroate synthase